MLNGLSSSRSYPSGRRVANLGRGRFAKSSTRTFSAARRHGLAAPSHSGRFCTLIGGAGEQERTAAASKAPNSGCDPRAEGCSTSVLPFDAGQNGAECARLSLSRYGVPILPIKSSVERSAVYGARGRPVLTNLEPFHTKVTLHSTS